VIIPGGFFVGIDFPQIVLLMAYRQKNNAPWNESGYLWLFDARLGNLSHERIELIDKEVTREVGKQRGQYENILNLF